MEDTVESFGKPDAIQFVGCNTKGTTPPEDLKTAKKKGIDVRSFESIKVDYVYSSWKVSIQGETGRDRIPGIRVPTYAKNGVITVNYWIKVQFGSRAVYFIMKQARNTPPEFHQVFIYCYGQHSGKRLNRNMESGRLKFA